MLSLLGKLLRNRLASARVHGVILLLLLLMLAAGCWLICAGIPQSAPGHHL